MALLYAVLERASVVKESFQVRLREGIAYRNWGPLAMMALVAALAYFPTLRGGFQIDDWGWFEMARNDGILGIDHT